MNIVLLIVTISSLIISIWIFGSWYITASVEKPSYRLIAKKNGYEIREYPAMIIATTVVHGDYAQSQNEAFKILADYIFGRNSKSQNIKMTAPVLSQRLEKIAMTAPVISTQSAPDTYEMAFVMPSSSALSTLAKPQDKRVQLRSVSSRRFAVITFRGNCSEAAIKRNERELIKMLARDRITARAKPLVARYNPPFAFPPLKLNEIWIEVHGS